MDQGNDYVECNECGHPLERHTTKGCDHCECGTSWTVKEIQQARKDAGLPVKFKAYNF
jgi:hypothetical protein